MTNLAVHHSSARDDWCTPPEVLERVRKVGRIGLDPCSNELSVVGARVELRLPDQDGMNAIWMPLLRSDELVYVNPPYGREIGDWIDKCREEAESDGVTVVALLPARTDTRWFQDAWHAQAICFWKGRLTFEGAPHPAPFPSALALWSKKQAIVGAFEDAFADAGKVVRL